MRKTVWKSQNLSKNRFSQGKHHLVPAVHGWMVRNLLLIGGLVMELLTSIVDHDILEGS